MTEIDFKQILDLIYALLPIIGAVASIPAVNRWLGKKKAEQVMGICNIAYVAVENAKRLNMKRTKKQLSDAEIKSLYKSYVKTDLKSNGIFPTKKLLKQAEIYAEAKNGGLK